MTASRRYGKNHDPQEKMKRSVRDWVSFVEDDEDDVETGQNSRLEFNLLIRTLELIVPTMNRVGSRQHSAATVQDCGDTLQMQKSTRKNKQNDGMSPNAAMMPAPPARG